MSSRSHQTIFPHHIFVKILNYGHISIGRLVQLMEVIFTLQPPHFFITPAKTEKALHLRTVYSPAPSTSFSHICLQDGKDLLLMPGFMRVPLVWILAFQMDGIFLQMLVFHTVRNFWFHTAEFGTILQSGVMQIYGIIFFSLFKKTLTMPSVI